MFSKQKDLIMRESFYKFRDDVAELFKKNIKNISKRDVLQKELDVLQKKLNQYDQELASIQKKYKQELGDLSDDLSVKQITDDISLSAQKESKKSPRDDSDSSKKRDNFNRLEKAQLVLNSLKSIGSEGKSVTLKQLAEKIEEACEIEGKVCRVRNILFFKSLGLESGKHYVAEGKKVTKLKTDLILQVCKKILDEKVVKH